MSLQERTLVIKNFDPDKTNSNLLKELCLQGGPVRNVVLKPDHAFVEFEDTESVGYSKALFDGVEMFGRRLVFEPKLRNNANLRYTKNLHDYVKYDRQVKAAQRQQAQFMQPLQFDAMIQSNGPEMNQVQQMPVNNCIPNQFTSTTSDNATSSKNQMRHKNVNRSNSFNHNRGKFGRSDKSKGSWRGRRR